MPRLDTLVRSWTVLKAIDAGPRTLAQLAAEAGVTTRTIRRDLEALEFAGFPVVVEQCDDGRTRWRLMRPAPLPAKAIHSMPPERLALRFSDVPDVLAFVEQVHSGVGALRARLQVAR